MDLDYFKKTFKLDSTSSEPMYKQISGKLPETNDPDGHLERGRSDDPGSHDLQ